MVGAIIFCVGGALQAAGQNLSFFYAGRAVAGLGVGMLVMIVPMYQAEIAHPSIRGRITGLQQLMLGIGAVFSSKSLKLMVQDYVADFSQHGRSMAQTCTTARANSGVSLSVFRLSLLVFLQS